MEKRVRGGKGEETVPLKPPLVKQMAETPSFVKWWLEMAPTSAFKVLNL